MILIVGEALVDLATKVDGSVEAHLGGGPFNAARAVARLGGAAAFCGVLSNDSFGRRLAAALVAEGVDVTPSPTVALPTTLALAELDAAGHASYRFYIEGTTVPALTPSLALDRLPAAIDAVLVGSLGLLLEPAAAAAEAIVSTLKGQALVMVDPNVRPLVIADRDRYLERLHRVIASADVVKLSVEDLDWMYPGSEVADAARSLLDRGPRLVMITAGETGAYVATPVGIEVVGAPPVTVVDTIGAGDTFSGAVLAWWVAEGRPDLGDPTAALAAAGFAVVAAAVNCSRAGADPPTRDEIDRFVS
ncbi:MAG: PfkB family carbohydrate kinase [Acidimicrobiia bacterium]